MSGFITLRPGTPDDANREHLPESLKGSDIVVNESGNNSQPYPVRLQEHRGIIADGITDVWFTYVPESYDPSTPTPLVVSLHGGLMTGWAQAVYSSWTCVADREGFIVVFPNAHDRRFWAIEIAPERIPAITAPNPEGMYLNVPPARIEDNHDMRLIAGLIEKTAQDYSIDRSRVFLQGMSMGEAMAAQFARYSGDMLAGLAGSGSPTDPALLFDDAGGLLNRAGPVPVWQSRLDLDIGANHFSADIPAVVSANLDYWRKVDGVDSLPAIAVRGVDNFAFYSGAHADVVLRDVANRDHGQTFDDAELVWDHFFSGLRWGVDGTIVDAGSQLPREGDRNAVAVAEGRRWAWVAGSRVELPQPVFAWEVLHYHGLGGEAVVRGRYVYVPLAFIAQTFGADLSYSDGGATAVLVLEGGRRLQFARGSIGCVLDGRVTSMSGEAVQRGGELHISLEWFACSVLDLRVSEHSGVLYVTDHHAQLSGNMARLLREILA